MKKNYFEALKAKAIKEWTRPVPETFGGVISSNIVGSIVSCVMGLALAPVEAKVLEALTNKESEE